MIKLMRRLNWDNTDISTYAIKCLSKAYNIRYHLIRCLADLVSGLSSYQSKAMSRVIDNVFEDIRAGLETHLPKLAQRRIAMAKYLGELYIYRLVESSNVLNTLYSIISLGVVMEPNYISDVDPPDSLFRLKLACVLLDTCGQYFTSATSRKRLDYFLIFFQQYYWYKKSDPIFSDDPKNLFPILVEHMYKDVFTNIHPKMKLYKSFEETKEAIEKLKIQLYPELFKQDGSGDIQQQQQNNELETITEIESETGDLTEDNTSEAPLESDDDDRETNRIVNDDDDILPYDDDDDGGRSSGDNQNYSPINDPILIEKKHERTEEDIEFELEFEKMASLKVSLSEIWRLTKQMIQHFWKRWHNEYLVTLQQRYKWQIGTSGKNIEIGDIVMIKDEDLVSTRWPIGKVIKTYAGADGCVRSVLIKTQAGEIHRAIHKLAKLPLSESADSRGPGC